MIESLVESLAAWCERRGRVLRITGTGGNTDVYLIRYYLLRSRFLNVFIHRFMRSDRDDLHDHPWDFWTYLVRGSYTEHRWNPKTGQTEKTLRENLISTKWGVDFDAFHTEVKVYVEHKRNRLVFRRAEDQHKVETDRAYQDTPRDRAQAPLTLCITGRTRREWGFIREEYAKVDEGTAMELAEKGIQVLRNPDQNKRFSIYRPDGRRWIPWREYLGLPPETPGRG